MIVQTPEETRPKDTTNSNHSSRPSTSTESTKETEPPAPTIAEDGMPFTEDSIVATRDLLYDAATNKQYITVETRNGNTFYIVIDYDKPVDEDGEQYYSIVENPKGKGKSYDKWLGDNKKPSHRERICFAIDAALAKNPVSFNALLEILQQEGYELKQGKVPSLRGPEQRNYIRMDNVIQQLLLKCNRRCSNDYRFLECFVVQKKRN